MLFTRMTRPFLAVAVLAAATFAGVAGVACDAPPAPPPVIPPVGDDDGEPDPDVVVDCANANPNTTAADLDQMSARFATEVFPLWTRAEGGCVQCHASDSDRLMKMAVTVDEAALIEAGDPLAPANGAADTFFRVRAGGFLRLTTGMAPARVLDESMPQDGPAWIEDEKSALLDFACDLATVDEGGIPPDEEFPPDLLSPYEGEAITDYDNTFLTFDQLKGRIDVQFDDEWVREGVDQFSANISLFGGADFVQTFVPARQATPEFFTGLDILAEDVCARAAADGTGPFAGLDLTLPTQAEPPSTTTVREAESLALGAPDGEGLISPQGGEPGCAFPNATSVNFCTNGGVRLQPSFPIDGDYVIRVVARGQEAGPDLPQLSILVDGVEVGLHDVPGVAFATYQSTATIAAGEHFVDSMFINDFFDEVLSADRNLLIDSVTVEGPITGSTAGSPTAEADARARLITLFERILLRAPLIGGADDEIAPLYAVVLELERFDGNREGAFAGACQGLVNHPDFLFTRPARFDEIAVTDNVLAGERARLLLIKTAFDLVDRPPTPDEFALFDLGASREEIIDTWLASDEARNAYYQRVRQILEYDGTLDGDEPARLWTYVMTADRPLQEVLTANYSVDESFAQIERDAIHGETGLLTMRGFIKGKPGLPHYNYAARVFTGFLGVVFEVPQAALDARATATAASTVDPASICYSCHRLLTPLAHQRLKWDDEGNRRELFEDGRDIDDSDQALVEDYPFKGRGLESFSLVAVRKEGFIRRMANIHFQLSFGRNMRHNLDERDVYFKLFEAAQSGQGTFKNLMRTVLTSRAYVEPPAPVAGSGGGT